MILTMKPVVQDEQVMAFLRKLKPSIKHTDFSGISVWLGLSSWFRANWNFEPDPFARNG
ncbi:hypothetical protein Pr1d_24310 [Bythopirellula goksoeyrii]|uniref:Uncharacterized protein n=1 Tax=Bythopirellula goksoeyrii TaxID=1400387 RepID=A0A5B9QC21_9BACT|nr:hypothetical protein Pr1d_24310 [Bythopirellula goksoeyrii]